MEYIPRLLVMVFHSDETVPYLVTICDEVIDQENGLIKLKTAGREEINILMDYDYYNVLETESEVDEELLVKMFSEFKKLLNK